MIKKIARRKKALARRHEANRTRRNSSVQLIMIMLLALGGSSDGFQPELAQEAFSIASDVSSPLFSSLDELLFVTTNLLLQDSEPTRRFPLLHPQLATPKQEAMPPGIRRSYVTSTDYTYDYDTHHVSTSISLSKEEEDLFQLIRNVRDEYCPNTTIRIAGGWVRDKLLGKPTSQDIDFVLSDKSGSHFATLFQQYLVEHHQDLLSVSSQKNYGARSKHLQTASLQVADFCIDFCRLRFEKYSPDSRVPEKTGIASAVEDAWRRDLTINSLFYNINTNQVEDWTEQGLSDLRLGNIATPMAPLATLLEDPFRILRAIRFASQLSFNMDPALVKAARDTRVRHALEQKVSRDSIGNEIDLVFQTRDPTRGMQLLMVTNLVDVIFSNGRQGASLLPEKSTLLYIYDSALRLLCRTQALVSRLFTATTQWDVSKRRLLWYAAFFKPFYDTSLHGSKRNRRSSSFFHQVLNHGLKRPSSDIQSIESIVKGTDALCTLLEVEEHNGSMVKTILRNGIQFATLSQQDPQWNEIATLRWQCYKVLKRIGPLWREALILALSSSQVDLTEATQRYADWVTLVEDRLGISDAVLNMKPLLSGSQIQNRALPGVHGEGFKRIMGAQEEWQVRHCTDIENSNREVELIEYLIKTFPEYAQ